MSRTATGQTAGVRWMFSDSSSQGVPAFVVVPFVTMEASKIQRVTAG